MAGEVFFMNLEGNWTVYMGENPVGQCDFMPQGLYWKMCCTIREGWEGVSRLVLFSEREPVSLGIPTPQGAVLTLERLIPRKKLIAEGELYLELLPVDAPLLSRREKKVETPPEQPFMEEPIPEMLPEQSPMEEPNPEPILIRPGDKLPPLENWRNFRVRSDNEGDFLLFQQSGG